MVFCTVKKTYDTVRKIPGCSDKLAKEAASKYGKDVHKAVGYVTERLKDKLKKDDTMTERTKQSCRSDGG